MLLFSRSGSIEDGMGKMRVRKDGTRFPRVLLEEMAEVCSVGALKSDRLIESLFGALKALDWLVVCMPFLCEGERRRRFRAPENHMCGRSCLSNVDFETDH
jgi:hypothetical protein